MSTTLTNAKAGCKLGGRTRTRVAGAKCVNDVEVPRFSRSGVGLRLANFIKSEYNNYSYVDDADMLVGSQVVKSVDFGHY